ncbi:osmotically inducible protein C [Alphaproteobacteria bacterium 46_93_T64]|nr:osmotically inducible protein C [Alphaproteobacteria bacterium 46_93_T64]
MPAKSEKIMFTSATGEQLAGRLDFPVGAPTAYALWAHCFSCTKDIYAASRVANGLTEQGIAVLRFDFTGLGASEGDFANTNFSSNVDDLVAAANFLRENYQAPKMLIGHSLGGAAVLAAASHVPEADAICTIGAPADPAHVAHNFQSSRAEIEEQGEAVVLLAGRPFRIKKQFLEDIEGQKLERDIAKMKKALLVFHSPIDSIVGVENAGTIFQAAKHPKSFVSLDTADHLLSKKEDAAYVANIIAAWAARYINLSGAGLPLPSAAPGTVVVAETRQGKFTNAISVGGKHQLIADEPPSVGGTNTGPTPYDYLLAGLGACKAMTMRMYAERKGYALDRAIVTLKHDKIHATDCETCETVGGRLDQITVEIEAQGDLDDATRQQIIDIADKCPVHRTLHSEVNIVRK